MSQLSETLTRRRNDGNLLCNREIGTERSIFYAALVSKVLHIDRLLAYDATCTRWREKFALKFGYHR